MVLHEKSIAPEISEFRSEATQGSLRGYAPSIRLEDVVHEKSIAAAMLFFVEHRGLF